MLEGIPVLSLLILLPLFGTVLIFAFGKSMRSIRAMALFFSGIPVVLVTMLFLECNDFSHLQYVESYDWIPSLGVSYTVGVDGISLPLLFITPLLTFLADRKSVV